MYDILDSTNKEEMRSEEKLILLQQVSRRVTYHNIQTSNNFLSAVYTLTHIPDKLEISIMRERERGVEDNIIRES